MTTCVTRWERCRSATSGESWTTFWTKVGLHIVDATPSRGRPTACCVVLAASHVDRRSEASLVLPPGRPPHRASSTCPVHIIRITGTAASLAEAIPRPAATPRPPTRSWWTVTSPVICYAATLTRNKPDMLTDNTNRYTRSFSLFTINWTDKNTSRKS